MKIRNGAKRYLLPGAVFALFVVAVVWINATIDSADYPIHVWRMDLDDAVANVAIVAGAAVGIWRVKLDADKAKREAKPRGGKPKTWNGSSTAAWPKPPASTYKRTKSSPV